MLLNSLCRLRQLNVTNYIVAAFDNDAFQFCREHVFPCFPVNRTDEAREAGKGAEKNATERSFHYGTPDYKRTTKLKSQQVLRLLDLGYNVLWSDVDIFWKVNPLDDIMATMGSDVDIAVQSNAPPDEEGLNGPFRINSGFYFVKNSNKTRNAFQAIVDHAAQSSLSEQPSFYSILCGDNRQFTQGRDHCLNRDMGVLTLFLDRLLYPNGAMENVLDKTAATFQDTVKITHFNWRTGGDTKIASLIDRDMWLLDSEEKCKFSWK